MAVNVKADRGSITKVKSALDGIKTQIITASTGAGSAAVNAKISLNDSKLKVYRKYIETVNRVSADGSTVPETVVKTRLVKDYTSDANSYNTGAGNIDIAAGNISGNLMIRLDKVIGALGMIDAAITKFEVQGDYSLGDAGDYTFTNMFTFAPRNQPNSAATYIPSRFLDENLNKELIEGRDLYWKNNQMTLDDYQQNLTELITKYNLSPLDAAIIYSVASDPNFKLDGEDEQQDSSFSWVKRTHEFFNKVLESTGAEYDEEDGTGVGTGVITLMGSQIIQGYYDQYGEKYGYEFDENGQLVRVEYDVDGNPIKKVERFEDVFERIIESETGTELEDGWFDRRDDEEEPTFGNTVVAAGAALLGFTPNFNEDEEEDPENGEGKDAVVGTVVEGAADLVDAIVDGTEVVPPEEVEPPKPDVPNFSGVTDDVGSTVVNGLVNAAKDADTIVSIDKTPSPAGPGKGGQGSGQGTGPAGGGNAQGGGGKDHGSGSTTGGNVVANSTTPANPTTPENAAETPAAKKEVENQVVTSTAEAKNETQPVNPTDNNKSEVQVEAEVPELPVKKDFVPPIDKVIPVKPIQPADTIAEGNKSAVGAIAGAAGLGAISTNINNSSISVGPSGGTVPSGGMSGGVSGSATNIPTNTPNLDGNVIPGQGMGGQTNNIANNSATVNKAPTVDNQVADNSSRNNAVSSTSGTNNNVNNDTSGKTNAPGKSTHTVGGKAVDDDTPSRTGKTSNSKVETTEKHATNSDENTTSENKGTLGSASVAVKELEKEYKKDVIISTSVTAGSSLAIAVIKFADWINLFIFILLLLAILLFYSTYRIKKKKEFEKKLAALEAQAMLEKNTKEEGITLEEAVAISEKEEASDAPSSEDKSLEKEDALAKEDVTEEAKDIKEETTESEKATESQETTEVKEKVEEKEEKIENTEETKEVKEEKKTSPYDSSDYVIINQPPEKKEEEK